MGYNISLVIDTGKEDYDVYEDHITYNVSPMFVKAFGEGGLNRFEEMLASEVHPILTEALACMLEEKVEYEKLNPPNGWGNFQSTWEFLRDLRDRCEEHPLCKIRIN